MNAWVASDKNQTYGPPHHQTYVVMFVGGPVPVLDEFGFWNQPMGNRIVIQGYLSDVFGPIEKGTIKAYTLTPN